MMVLTAVCVLLPLRSRAGFCDLCLQIFKALMNGADGVVQDYLCNGSNWSLLIFYYFRFYAVPHSFRLAFSTSVTHYLSCIVHNGARRVQHDHSPLNKACAKVVHCSHSGPIPSVDGAFSKFKRCRVILCPTVAVHTVERASC